jgi:hypothetical protein
MTVREWLDEQAEESEAVLLADGFDDALLGYAQRVGQPPVAIYDRAKCIAVLMTRDSMTHEDAEEYFEFNVAGSWVGAGTPCFLVRPDTE